MNDTKALVIFSGGQDSTTCLGVALKNYKEVEAITFIYGQKHSIEVEQAKKICGKLNVKQHVIDISFFGQIVDSALTSNGDVNQKHSRLTDLPASFVPNRNQMFITIAHALAQKIGAEVLVTGVCDTDFSGYPDCREVFIKAVETTTNLGSGCKIKIETPLMRLDKAETFELAKTYDCLDLVIEDSITCYNGNREIRHDWGYGCNECPSCKLRARGWEQYRERVVSNG